MAQLTVTVGFIALFVFVPEVSEYSKNHQEMMWIAFALSMVLLIVLGCFGDFRRRWPLNIILLGLFTICESFMLGTIASFYDVKFNSIYSNAYVIRLIIIFLFSNTSPFLQSKEVLIAAGICTVVCLSITLFSLQTKWDFTVCGGFIFVSLVVLLMFGIMAICMPSSVMNLLYASLGALVFSLYLVFDTQLMLGGSHKYSISPEEYIFAALNLYLDIVNIFIYILAIVGGSNR